MKNMKPSFSLGLLCGILVALLPCMTFAQAINTPTTFEIADVHISAKNFPPGEEKRLSRRSVRCGNGDDVGPDRHRVWRRAQQGVGRAGLWLEMDLL